MSFKVLKNKIPRYSTETAATAVQCNAIWRCRQASSSSSWLHSSLLNVAQCAWREKDFAEIFGHCVAALLYMHFQMHIFFLAWTTAAISDLVSRHGKKRKVRLIIWSCETDGYFADPISAFVCPRFENPLCEGAYSGHRQLYCLRFDNGACDALVSGQAAGWFNVDVCR